MRSHYVAQIGLKFLTSSDPPTPPNVQRLQVIFLLICNSCTYLGGTCDILCLFLF